MFNETTGGKIEKRISAIEFRRIIVLIHFLYTRTPLCSVMLLLAKKGFSRRKSGYQLKSRDARWIDSLELPADIYLSVELNVVECDVCLCVWRCERPFRVVPSCAAGGEQGAPCTSSGWGFLVLIWLAGACACV